MTAEQGCMVCGAFVGHADACPAYIEDLKQERDALKAALERIVGIGEVTSQTAAYIARQALKELEEK